MNNLFASLGSIFTAFLASSCCIGPLTFTLLGVGGIGFGASFEKYRPLLIVITTIQIGISYYLVNRPLDKICIDGKCDMDKAAKKRKINRIILGITGGVAVVFLFIPQILVLIA
ncbi:hypothetical protein E3V55_03740 [Candidatus Marinimicrobia bacterium MT.SAG.3]|nr:hypothetical protein E3V55_03740 [Candidatus Marinimicrobia bacterium MT.SAG.3]